MCYKCIKTKICSKTQVAFLKPIQVLLHQKLQVHSMESSTIVLQIIIAFKGIKILLHCEMSSKKPNTDCIMNYIQVNQMDQNILHSHLLLYNCIVQTCRVQFPCSWHKTVQTVMWAFKIHITVNLDSLVITNY